MQVPKFERGDGLTARALNRIVQALMRADFIRVGEGLSLRRSGRGIVIGLAQRIPGVRVTQRMQVTAINNDYISGKLVYGDGSLGANAVNIARPPQLRHAAANYSGITSVTTTDAQTMDATDGTDTETLKVTPLYLVGESIYAVTAPRGGTGVEDAPDWLDTNCSGKQWAKVAS